MQDWHLKLRNLITLKSLNLKVKAKLKMSPRLMKKEILIWTWEKCLMILKEMMLMKFWIKKEKHILPKSDKYLIFLLLMIGD